MGKGDADERAGEARVVRALELALLLVSTDRSMKPRLGFAPQPIFRYFTRNDYWTLFAIARENGCTVEEVRAEQGSSGGDRTAAEMRREAAYRLINHLNALSPPVAEVIRARATGVSWRKIGRILKGRVFTSVMDDFREGCRRLACTAEPEIRELV